MIAEAEAAGRRWTLFYGGRARASMGFLDELAAYGDRVVVWPEDERGMLDLDEILGQPQPGTLVYSCGPEGLLQAVESRCTAWPAGQPARRAVRRQAGGHLGRGHVVRGGSASAPASR